MPQNLDQLALLTGLLMNWDGIYLRMASISPQLALELRDIAQRLQNADASEEIADIIDDLLDLTRGTAAYVYVQSLVGRSANLSVPTTRDYEVRDVAERVIGIDSVIGMVPTPSKSGDSDPLAIDGSRVLGTLISAEPEIARVPIFYATNRTRSADLEVSYTGEPATELSFGLAPVTIPVEKHEVGQVETPAWWNPFADAGNERQFVTLGGLEPLSQSAFLTRLEALLQTAAAKDLLIFLHGFNVTFEEAARRAAQIAFDMKFPGAVILFSWPSAGSVWAYSNDEDRALVSADRFAAFLRSLEGGPWNRVHVMAHSMGNRVMLLGLADNPRPKLPLGQVVFTAADVYVPLFQDKFPRLQSAGLLSATSYASNCDWPLRLSNRIHRGARVGLISGDPFVAPQLVTVDASAVDTVFFGHGYFAGERSLITDLRLLLYNSLSPGERGLTAANNYWLFPK